MMSPNSTTPLPSAGEERRGRFSRRTALRSAAVGATALGVGGLTARQARAQAVTVNRIKVLTGAGLTTQYDVGGTDLGVPTTTPDGRTLYVFGDTFSNLMPGSDPNWRSPVGLYSQTADLNAGVTWTGAVGGPTAKQLWPYEHNNGTFDTVIPTDVIKIGGSLYLHAVVTQNNLTVVKWTEIQRSDDNGENWTLQCKFPVDFWRDRGQNIFGNLTWAEGGDGWVYGFCSPFGRVGNPYVFKVPTDQITNPAAYVSWGHANGAWDWGNPPTPVLEEKFGEASLRPLGGKWVLTFFCPDLYRIDGMLLDLPTSDAHAAKRQTFISGGGDDDTHLDNLYGSYIIPGSTLDELHLVVSQWTSSKYQALQWRVRGFGSS